jgi:hypothetical protein
MDGRSRLLYRLRLCTVVYKQIFDPEGTKAVRLMNWHCCISSHCQTCGKTGVIKPKTKKSVCMLRNTISVDDKRVKVEKVEEEDFSILLSLSYHNGESV